MIQKASKEDYPRLLEIWESAVLATHDFLSEEDFEFYRNRMPKYLENTDIYKFTNIDFEILGFIGVSASSVEMLFIENASRGIGIGKKLISFAINKLHIIQVSVNEQNTQALRFYKKLGFREIGHSLLDYERKEYPIIFMEL